MGRTVVTALHLRLAWMSATARMPPLAQTARPLRAAHRAGGHERSGGHAAAV